MQATAHIIDLTRYRQRRQARRNAELMWEMYAARAGLAEWTVAQVNKALELRQVKP
ncbi:putative secreted Zn-dependent protease [Pseudomonas sp. JUb42]|jgi:predicted secreted Zn-dependent protease|uniref:hypothetical protein n=1 Tax=Pseudomonas sp. JUb42 TaxID=2940611 RepID=UPI002168EBEC|nr:hypothetical protein [Pseudomonas sp. JUb42]MCS3468630.1 putative secreted Zn-dependent protease [Pseudomonas sp. JUb42]